MHYSTEREKDRNEWEVQRFVPPGEIFERADVENFVSGLKPKTGYVFQIIVDINSMREHPRSAIVAIETPDGSCFLSLQYPSAHLILIPLNYYTIYIFRAIILLFVFKNYTL